MPDKKDKRSWRTERAIMDAMMELLGKEDFGSITVNDICMAASVSRTTFYLYFEDKYALVLRAMDHAIALPDGLTDENMEQNFYRILTFHYSLRNSIARLWANSKSIEIRDRLEQVIHEEFLGYYQAKEAAGAQFHYPVEMVAAHNSGGISHLIRWWHRSKYPMDEDTMVRYMVQKTQETAHSFTLKDTTA